MAVSTDPDIRELTRKLYWSVSSTIPNLSKQQKSSTFTWAANLAERIMDNLRPSLPPAVDTKPSNGYHGQAEGRGGGRHDPSYTGKVRPLPPPNMPAWEKQQEALRVRAWAHVSKQRANALQLPIPDDVYREVGYGSSHSTS